MAKRLQAMGQTQYQGTIDKNGRWSSQINFVESALGIPLKRKKPTMWFVNSMSDLFHADVKFDWLDAIWQVMFRTPQHTYQILTKRAHLLPDRVQAMVDAYGVLPNVWIGTSVESQQYANERIPYLIRTPAAVRFLSCEPLVGPVSFDLIDGMIYDGGMPVEWQRIATPPIHWVIVGGESGPGARPMHPDWARQIRDQCTSAGISFFFKQWGAWCQGCGPGPEGVHMSADGQVVRNFAKEHRTGVSHVNLSRVGKKSAGRLLDGREWNEMPGD